jgi:hypothetical protein
MKAAVDLNEQLSLETGEIDNEWTDWHLPSNLATFDLTPTQSRPEPLLGRSWIVAEVLSESS